MLPQQATSIGYNYAYGFGPERGWEVDDTLSLVGNYPVGTDLMLLSGGEGGALQGMKKRGVPETGCSVRMIRQDEPPSILLDFGRLCTGRFRLEIADAPAGARIDIAYGESLNVTYIDRYVCREGKQAFSPYHRRVARYVLLTFRAFRRPLVISKAAFDFISYPVKNRGRFECSDKRLTRIWETARRTVHLSMQDHFEDSIWREQKLYAGDMHVQALAAYYGFGETRYVRKCLRQLALIPRSSGWIAHAGPAACPDEFTIIDFPARYIMSLRDYVLASGDLAFLEDLYPIVQGQIREYESMKHTRGLLDVGYKGGFSWQCFLNWGEIHKQGAVAGLNFLFIQALEATAELAVYLGHHADAKSYRVRADQYRRRLNKELWDPRKGLYADCIARGRRSRCASVETNTLALLAGGAPAQRRNSIVERMTSSRTPWVTKTPFFNCFVVEALFQAGQPQAALDVLRGYWGEMTDRGADTFWEAFDPETPPGSLPHKLWSLCHGWSSGPLYLVGAYLLGVRPTAPGFRSIRLQPRPLDVGWASGTVPTPRGNIDVEWEKASRTIEIRAPKRIATELCLDGCPDMTRVFLNGRRHKGRV